MRTKNVVYFLSFLLISSAVTYCAGASQTNSVSFHGVGVTVYLSFPEEAHPLENIYHNLTITAYEYVNSLNITLFIYAPVNSTWQIIDQPHIILWPFPLGVNQSLPTVEINFTLPQNADGTLYCRLDVQTNQSADYPSFTFYTTQVRNLTYSDLLSKYNEFEANYSALESRFTELSNRYDALWIMYNDTLAKYTDLLPKYEALLGDYDRKVIEYENLTATYKSLNSTHYSLQANYNSLEANYSSILAMNNALQLNYNSLDSSHSNLQTIYNSLLGTKNTLQSNYNALNSTHSSVEANYALLRATYDSLNRTYTALETEFNSLTQTIIKSENALNNDRIVMFIFVAAVAGLVAFVIYLKQKKPEPYVVIRKETVTMKQDEKQ
jgi:predicted nuclease with TOPRIM domain